MADIKSRVMQAMRELPALPVAVQKLLTILSDPDASATDVTRVLSSDQALAGKILKLANSPLYGLSGQVATVTRAVVVLGFGGVRSVATGFGMARALEKLGGGGLVAFWRHAVAVAAGAQAVAQTRPQLGADPEEAFIAGLLHDVGHVILASAVPDDYLRARAAVAKDADPLLAERSLLGMDHAQVGQKLMEYWKLPEALQDAARRHHSVELAAGGSQPLTTVVAVADILAALHGASDGWPIGEDAVRRLSGAATLTVSELGDLADELTARGEAVRGFLKVADEPVAEVAVAAAPVVIVSLDQARQQWLATLLRRYGHPLFPAKDFFGREAGARDVRLVVLDPGELTRDKVVRLRAFLSAQPLTTCVLAAGDAGAAGDLLDGLPSLPYVFSRADIAALCRAPQPA